MSNATKKKRRCSVQNNKAPVVKEYVRKKNETRPQKPNPFTSIFITDRARLTFSLACSIALSVYGSSFLGAEHGPGKVGTMLARYLASVEKNEIMLERVHFNPTDVPLHDLATSVKGRLNISSPSQEAVTSGNNSHNTSSGTGTLTSGKTHVVQAGETLTRIAHRYGVDALELARLNNIENINLIKKGQVLRIPERQQPYIIPITEEEIELFQRLVEAEAGSEPFLGKVAVAAVVINRVLSPGFPDTVREVIYEPRQFQPVTNGRINRVKPSEESIAAVYAALSGVDPLRGSLFFYNPTISDPVLGEWHTTREPTGIIGQHHFSR